MPVGREPLYRIGELASLAGVSSRTVDYYTQIGLLQSCRRTAGNYRLYGQEALERLKLIVAYREQGLPLSAIDARLSVLGNGDGCAVRDRLDRIQGLLEQMGRECAEIADMKPRLSAAATRDRRLRMALSRAAGDILHKAILLSGLLTSAGEEGSMPPMV